MEKVLMLHSQRRTSAIGAVQKVTYLNDHLPLMLPQASDHGQVLLRVRLYGYNGA